MKTIVLLILLLTGVIPSLASAIDSLADYRWHKRILLIFSPSLESEALKEQKAILSSEPDGLEERDLVIWLLPASKKIMINGKSTGLPSPPYYDEYQVLPGEFKVILIGKDGTEKLREETPLSLERLFQHIDAMPMRQREMQEQSD